MDAKEMLNLIYWEKSITKIKLSQLLIFSPVLIIYNMIVIVVCLNYVMFLVLEFLSLPQCIMGIPNVLGIHDFLQNLFIAALPEKVFMLICCYFSDVCRS